MMEAIAAVYSDWGIGDGSTQPVTLKADRQHFREITRDAAVIVGRKTLEDFPGGRPLKGRVNIVVTRQQLTIPGAVVADSTLTALQLAAQYPRCLVIGGASIYEQFFPYINKVHITKIGCCPSSARFFPDLDREEDWACTEEGPLLEEEGIPYRFCIYERRSSLC